MKKRISTIISHSCVMVTLAAVLLGCGEECSRVATRENGVITVDYSAAMAIENSEVKLSDFVRDYSYVQLKGGVEDYVDYIECITENYILASRYNSSIKLFNRENGEFIRDIGAVGKGHGEYGQIRLDVWVNEELERVYVWWGNCCLVYDINGDFVSKLELGGDYYISAMCCDEKSGAIILFGFTKGGESLCAKFSSDGEFMSEAHDLLDAEASSMVSKHVCTSDGEYTYYYNRDLLNKDKILYCYDVELMQSLPVFRVVNMGRTELSEIGENSLWVNIKSIGKYFVVQDIDFKILSQDGNKTEVTSSYSDIYLVDKDNLEIKKTASVLDDYILCQVPYNQLVGRGYFYYSLNPITMANMLREAMEELPEDADDSSVERMKRMLTELDEEGNTVVASGKYKH